MSKEHIKQALAALNFRAAAYQKIERYYSGLHNLVFATEKFKNAFGDLFRSFADNLCPAVVDAVADKLQVTGFRVEEGDAALADEAWAIWQRNRMDRRAGETHLEALRAGDAYVIVWPNDKGDVMIYPNRSSRCVVAYDEETPGLVLWGAKLWAQPDKKVRLNLYFPDRIEKYITTQSYPNGMPDAESAFIEYQPIKEAWPLPNEWGVVPVFHFANDAAIGQAGRSELACVVPLQDALNKAVLDMMVAMEFSAFRQRWASGIEIEYDRDNKPIPPFIPGVERLWAVDSPDAKFGEFDTTDLSQFIKVQDNFRAEIARVSGTPLHYLLLQSGDFPSGEAMKTAEARFLAKVKDRQGAFGNVWEDVMALALRMSEKGDKVRLFTEWADPAPVSVKEQLEALLLKQTLGVPTEQLLTEAGYGEADIKKMMQQQEDQRDAARKEFNSE